MKPVKHYNYRETMKYTSAWRFIISLLLLAFARPLYVLGQDSNEYVVSMQMLQLVNNARILRNIRPLCLSNKLVRAATAHSAYEASINTMTHDGPLGLGDRFIKQGYQPSSVAENVGFTSTPFTQVVFDIWMSSPEHRSNILDPTYVHFGSANAQGSNGMYFWTQLFAKPMDMNLESCDFTAATAAARLTPGQPGFNPNGIYGPGPAGPSGLGPNGNCVSVDNGIGGKTLSCRMNSRYPVAGGPNVGPNPNPFFGPNGVVVNPPGYSGSSCVVVSTSPAPDGQGSVRVIKCSSNPPGAGAAVVNPVGYPGVGAPVIINPDSYINNPPGYNPPGYNPIANNPPGYNPPGYDPGINNNLRYNPPGYNPLTNNPPGYNPPGYDPLINNPPGYNPVANNPPGYNPPGINPVGPDPLLYNPPGYNPPGYNPIANNPPGYNPPGYNPAGPDPLVYNPPGYNPVASNPPGYNPPGYNPVANNPPGYNPPGYNPVGPDPLVYNPPGYNPVANNPPGYNPPGYNPVGPDPLVYNPIGPDPLAYNPPGTNPPGYNPPGYNPPGYNPPGYNPPGYNPPGVF